MKPNKYMLVRKMEKEKEKFVHQMGLLLDEMVNYGTHVLDICEKEKPFTELDTPIGTTYTQFLSMLDGISILIRKGNGDAIKPVLRSLLETKFNLEYLIKVEPEKGVLAYKLAHIHNQIKQLKRLDPKTDQGREFLKTTRGVELPPNNSNKRLQLLEEKLESPKYKKVQEEWDRLKKQYKKEPLWHALFQGQRTIKDMADFLEQSVYYSIVYKELSEDVHGGSTIKRLRKSDEDNIGISPGIRRIEEIPAMAYLSIKFAEEVFSVMIKEYNSKGYGDFSYWFNKNIALEHEKIAFIRVDTDYQLQKK